MSNSSRKGSAAGPPFRVPALLVEAIGRLSAKIGWRAIDEQLGLPKSTFHTNWKQEGRGKAAQVLKVCVGLHRMGLIRTIDELGFTPTEIDDLRLLFDATMAPMLAMRGDEVPRSLFGKGRPITPPAEPQDRRVSGVSVHFTFNFHNVETTDQIAAVVEKLRAAIGATADIGVLSVEEGSVILTLDMSEDDVVKLASAIGELKLDELSISEISLPPNPAMLRVKEMFKDVYSVDLQSDEYEKSRLHTLGLKNVWYLIHIANALNMQWNVHYQHLLTEAAAEAVEPTADEILAARLLVQWLPAPPSTLLKPEIDSSGAMQIIRRLHPGQQLYSRDWLYGDDTEKRGHSLLGDAGVADIPENPAESPEEHPTDQSYMSEDDSDDAW